MNQASRPRPSARNVTAVLGPTNTGKTHLAIERMLGHESGLIGLPLRLLAREVYGRVAARAGVEQVALVTGEEKIVPPAPRYWVCTVEAMPREADVAFLAIDEVQIAADFERGHVFTDRILFSRGSQETLLLGAATMRGIVEQLLPGVHVVTRPRMSVLAYAGQKKLTRLPERSAIVAFSADEVYAVAELIRRQRGGAAVVLGALSPRTRNKQVEIYQSGDVDFLVATDAIGMGLNLDLDHVAFAGKQKYDGYQFRDLSAAELGQIAGRAGRHMRDGTFGVTGRVDPFPDPLVEAVESHRFEPVRTLQWRNPELDFATLAALKASLEEPPRTEGLTKAPPADDQSALEALSRDEEVRDRARGAAQVQRLWDVCRLPDYRKIAPAQHAQLIGEIFGFIADGGVVPDDWIAAQIRQSNHTDGDIDTLSNRVAHIRTWAFVANQSDWLADPAHWRDEARAVEDALSDALHEKLTKRFVDRRTSVLMRRLRENTMLEAEITPAGEVKVEGHHVGALSGFRFTPDVQSEGPDAQALRNAAQKALATALTDRAERLAKAGDAEIVLSLDGNLRWGGEPVGRLVAADDALKPRLVLLADEQLSAPARELVEGRLTSWLATHVAALLKPLVDLRDDQALTGMARGIAFRLLESFGVLDRRTVQDDIRALDQDARAGLRRLGVRFGAHHIYLPALLKPGPATLLAQLWALKHRDGAAAGLPELSAMSGSGRTSAVVDPALDPEFYRRFGFRVYGARAVRLDILERVADLIRPALQWSEASTGDQPAGAAPGGRGFVVTPPMTSLLGASGEDAAAVFRGLGYRMELRPKPVETPEASATEPVGELVGEPVTPAPADPAAERPASAESQADARDIAAAGQDSDGPGSPAGDPDIVPTPEPPPTEVPDDVPPVEEPPPADLPEPVPPLEEPPVEEPRFEPSEAPIEEPGPDLPDVGDGGLEMAAAPPAEPADVAPTNDGAPASAGLQAAAELEMIEVWRPDTGRRRPEGRHAGRREGRGRSGPSRPAGQPGRILWTRGENSRGPQAGGEAGAADASGAPFSTGDQAPDAAPNGELRPQRHDPSNRPDRGSRPDRGEQPGRQGRPRHGERSERGGGPPRGDRDRGRKSWNDAGRSDAGRSDVGQGRPQRDRAADPDSPFAALAALKASLEQAKPE